MVVDDSTPVCPGELVQLAEVHRQHRDIDADLITGLETADLVADLAEVAPRQKDG
jgi:alkyl hydroperoxide reductase subunit AhpC